MMKVTGFNELAQAMEYDHIVKTHEKTARKVLISERVKELIGAGVDREVAKVLANVEYEYEL